MDERVEEIKPISRVCPVRKLALARPRRGRRELMYQFNRYHKAKKPNRINKKISDVSQTTESSTILNSNDFVAGLKKRIEASFSLLVLLQKGIKQTTGEKPTHRHSRHPSGWLFLFSED